MYKTSTCKLTGQPCTKDNCNEGCFVYLLAQEKREIDEYADKLNHMRAHFAEQYKKLPAGIKFMDR